MPSHYNDLHLEDQEWDTVVITKPKTQTKTNVTESTSSFARHLLSFRRKAGLTQSSLAQSLGITLSQYEEYENGSVVPTKSIISRINRLCSCNLFMHV